MKQSYSGVRAEEFQCFQASYFKNQRTLQAMVVKIERVYLSRYRASFRRLLVYQIVETAT